MTRNSYNDMRKIITVYSIIMILSAFGFSTTNGLICEVVDHEHHVIVYAHELMSSGNDDDLIITFWSVAVFSCIFIIGILPHSVLGNTKTLIVTTMLCGVQILFLSGGVEAGSLLKTLSIDHNIFLCIWTCCLFSFIPVSIAYHIFLKSQSHSKKTGK